MARVDLEGKLDMALIVIDGPLPTAAPRLRLPGSQNVFSFTPCARIPPVQNVRRVAL